MSASVKQTKRALPPGWCWVRLGEVCELEMGQSPSGESYNNHGKGAPLLNGPTEFGPIHPVAAQWTNAPTKFARKNDILFCVRGATTGRKNVADHGYCIGRGLAAIRGKDERADTGFVWFVLDVVTDSMLQKASGSTFANLPGKALQAFPLPLPPLPEQRRIAAILKEQMAAVDKARAAAEARLEAVKALPAAFLREVFPKHLATLPTNWQWSRLGRHVSKIGSGCTPRGGQSAYLAKGIPLIRSQNVRMNMFDEGGLAFISSAQDEAMSESRVRPDDVLLNITGASIGRVCVAPRALCPANVNQHVAIIRSDGTFDPVFLAYYVATDDFQKHIMDSQSGATRQALTKAMIANFDIPLPSLNDQRRLAARLREQMAVAEQARAAAEAELAAINDLPAALLRRAFNGGL